MPLTLLMALDIVYCLGYSWRHLITCNIMVAAYPGQSRLGQCTAGCRQSLGGVMLVFVRSNFQQAFVSLDFSKRSDFQLRFCAGLVLAKCD